MNFYGFKKSRKCSVFVIDSYLKESFLSSEEQGETAVFAGYPFPSRFINRTPCFPQKVSYFRDSRIPPLKIKLDEDKIGSLSYDRFPFLPYIHFPDFTAAGIWVS